MRWWCDQSVRYRPRLYSEEEFLALTQWMHECFAAAGAPLAACTFARITRLHGLGPIGACDCRKPGPGMLLQRRRNCSSILARSILFGDRNSDLVAARLAGVPHRILLGVDGRADRAMMKTAVRRPRAFARSPLRWRVRGGRAMIRLARRRSALRWRPPSSLHATSFLAD